MSGSRSSAVVALVMPTAVLWGIAATAGAQDSIETNRAALEAFFHATGGPGWTNSSNWLSDTAPLGDWYGVTTDASGRVTELRLVRNALSGQLPAESGALANLRILELGQNALTGPIPAELSTLANLQILGLGRNALSGPIPAELGRLTNLLDMSLSNNALTGPIPVALSALASLAELDLGGNRLTGSVPAALENLYRLERLYLRDNQLTGPLPRKLTALAVRELNISGTRACVPADAGFETWVRSMDFFRGENCDAFGLPFTGPPPMPITSPIREVHITELRVYVDSLRLRCGLDLFPWTDAEIVRNVTPVKALHVNELRGALSGAYEACDTAAPLWSDRAPASGVPIRAAHFAELRDAVVAAPRTAGGFDLSAVTWLHHNVSDWPETSRITDVRIRDVPAGGICIEHTKSRDWPGVGGVIGTVIVAGNPWVFAQVDGRWYAATYEWLRPGQTCKLNVQGHGPPSRELGPHIKVPPLTRWVPESGEMVGFMVSTPARTGPRGPRRERSNIEFVIWP